METEETNRRTHEPSLREITAELDGFKALTISKLNSLENLINERDKQYTERAVQQGKAVYDALQANDKLYNAQFAASEKAVAKSDINSEKWRDNANEWRGAMIDRETKFASRIEVENELKNVQKEIQALREHRSQGSGRTESIEKLLGWIIAGVAIAIAYFK